MPFRRVDAAASYDKPGNGRRAVGVTQLSKRQVSVQPVERTACGPGPVLRTRIYQQFVVNMPDPEPVPSSVPGAPPLDPALVAEPVPVFERISIGGRAYLV